MENNNLDDIKDEDVFNFLRSLKDKGYKTCNVLDICGEFRVDLDTAGALIHRMGLKWDWEKD